MDWTRLSWAEILTELYWTRLGYVRTDKTRLGLTGLNLIGLTFGLGGTELDPDRLKREEINLAGPN